MIRSQREDTGDHTGGPHRSAQVFHREAVAPGRAVESFVLNGMDLRVSLWKGLCADLVKERGPVESAKWRGCTPGLMRADG